MKALNHPLGELVRTRLFIFTDSFGIDIKFTVGIEMIMTVSSICSNACSSNYSFNARCTSAELTTLYSHSAGVVAS